MVMVASCSGSNRVNEIDIILDNKGMIYLTALHTYGLG